MEDLGCPRCKTTKYRNPSLKLMVNVCGHSLCEKCVELLFVRGSGRCETCQIPLRRNNFRAQTFEDADVERDVDIRRKILKDFNKKESDFATLRDYNDYLEEVETITFNMTYGIDVEETKQKIEKYKQENQDIIKKNRSKLSQEELEIEEIIRQQEYDQEMSRQQQLEDEQFERQQKQKQKAELIDELMFSDLPAEHILQSHRKELLVQPIEKPRPVAEKATKFTSGILVGKQEQFVHTRPAEVASVLYHYEPFHINLIGPESPDLEKLDRVNYLTHIRNATDKELAGGFVSNIACHRALQEAFCGLYLFPEINNR